MRTTRPGRLSPILPRASLTPGSIYPRFPDKDALLREVFIRMLEVNYRGSQELLKPGHWEGKSLAKICRYVIEETLNGHSRHLDLLRAFTSFTLQHPDTLFIRRCEDPRLLRKRGGNAVATLRS